MEHLTSAAAHWLNEPDEDRIAALNKDKWVGHTQAQHILARLADLHRHPPSDRMPNLLVVGDPSSGKTAILRHYAKAYQPVVDARRTRPLRWPVLFVQITNGPDERALYETILDVTQAPYAAKARLEAKRWHVIQLLRDMEVKMLFLDELHHMLLGSALQQRKFLAGLKYLANELRIPLVCAGIESAHNAICLDEQLASRFEVARLTHWSMNQEFVRLLASFERVLALRQPSHLVESALAFKLLELSGGSIGRLWRVLKLAAVHAVRTGTERITLDLLRDMNAFPLADDNPPHGHVSY